MSKVSIQGDQNGTGDFTIKAPNSNSDRTLNLPDEAGTVLTNASDIETQVKTATNATGSAPVYACRAWVNFDGTGTVSIRDSGNVSSITDNATGTYQVNFVTAMPDKFYSASVTGTMSGTAAGYAQLNNNTATAEFKTTDFNIRSTRFDGNQEDHPYICCSVFR